MLKIVSRQVAKTKQVLQLKGRSKSSKVIGVISDIHDGSVMGMISRRYPANRWQTILREHWLECIDKVGRCELLLLNGEPINGLNKKKMGYGNWTSDINTQIWDAVECVKEWKYDEILVTRGSGYHISDGAWTNYEETFARVIGAVQNGEWEGEYTDEETAFGFAGKIFNACHHVPGSKWFHYITTPLTREGMGLSLNRTKYYDAEQVKHIDVMVRSHRHFEFMTYVGNTMLCATPCWQFRTEYMKGGGMGSVYPTIGCNWFTIEQNGRILYEKNDLPDWKIPKKELLMFAKW